MKKKNAKKPQSRKRYFGLTKIQKGAKFCWLSHHNKHGWSLGYAFGKRTVWLTNIRFASAEEVKRALKGDVVFVKMKGE